MPNSQRLLFTSRSHMVGGGDFGHFMELFLDHPWQKLVSDNKDIIVY